ncbi:4-aminobutyrate aminotransferase [Metasolibacillus meyeri]|uniref:4-aminobutyrate aminotransferase n=1 Tax=Metasolibacillus meyeri TaxID=1071052 RepID=UPI000D30BFC4|nr:4-aminobutyrate aminotransferase [Metasolibacillus meyeri]
MEEFIGLIVVFVLIIGLVYALVKQIQDTQRIKDISNSSIRKSLKRKLIIMNISLLGIIIFFSLNVMIRFSIISSNYISSNESSLGVFCSLIIYIFAKVIMSPKKTDSLLKLRNL